MSVFMRVRNAYSYGGIKEVFRKSLFLIVYKLHNIITREINKNTSIEYGLNRVKRDENIIVSLTSFPERFIQLGPCLKSLVIQKCKPDRIIVYLGNDTKPEYITDEMHSFEKYGVEFRIDNKLNLMPHKKYIYAMQEFSKSIIVTADDDVIYPRDWLKTLYSSYKKYPKAISARRVHLMKRNEWGLVPYDHWEDQCRRIDKPSMSLIATGNSGVLYPPHCLGNDAFDVAAIKQLCLRADDIWLKCMEVKNKIPVVWVKNWEVALPDIASSPENMLSNENVFTGKNDRVLENVMKYCNISFEDFFD